MSKANDIARAEELAQGLAKASLRNHIVVNNNGHYFAIPKPNMSDFALLELKHLVFRRIGASVESEWDTTGRRVD